MLITFPCPSLGWETTFVVEVSPRSKSSWTLSTNEISLGDGTVGSNTEAISCWGMIDCFYGRCLYYFWLLRWINSYADRSYRAISSMVIRRFVGKVSFSCEALRIISRGTFLWIYVNNFSLSVTWLGDYICCGGITTI